ncbi:MAG: LysM peptidoglycan-binding domain-containing protein [Candidatus Latescibacteria bacterium]|nr:LysM peptidoglycan-binding domain-containing protein [Candidatus Latescibacterota bacterium]
MMTPSKINYISLCLILFLSCAPLATIRNTKSAIETETLAPDAISVAGLHYLAGKSAVENEQWELAELELDRALSLLWRPDFASIPRWISEERRILRSETEALLSIVLSHNAPSVTYTVEPDSLFAEELGVQSGFDQLLKLSASGEVDQSVDAVMSDPANFDIPILLNDHVVSAINLLRTDGSYRFTSWLNLSNLYAPLIRSVFQRESIPGDLEYAAMIGSGYQPRAFSDRRAAGLWQLSLPTSKDYGLRRTSWVDERLDPKKATWAAARHFKALYKHLKDWNLVLAAHYAGLEPVQTAMGETGTSDVWSLNLSPQVMSYVSLVHAAAIISKDPSAYGIQPQRTLPVTYETVAVDQSLQLRSIAEGMKVTPEQLKALNPELRKWRVPAGGYMLKVPVGDRRSYMSWAGIVEPGPDPGDIIVYTVRRGDNILKIARRFQVFADDIIAENEIRRPDRLKIGQALFIPSYGQRRSSPPSTRSSTKVARSRQPVAPYPVPDSKTHNKISYRVRRGDNLEGIGRRYGVPIRAIQSWNDLRDPRDLMAGQSISIWIPNSVASNSTGSSVPTGKKSINYTILRGDTLWDIARKFDVTVSSIQAANNLTRRSRIYPGDKLTIHLPK